MSFLPVSFLMWEGSRIGKRRGYSAYFEREYPNTDEGPEMGFLAPVGGPFLDLSLARG